MSPCGLSGFVAGLIASAFVSARGVGRERDEVEDAAEDDIAKERGRV